MWLLKKFQIKRGDFIAKSSESHKSVKIGSLKNLDCYRFSDDSLDKLSAAFTSYPPLDAIGIEDDLLKAKHAYPYENGQTIESFYEPPKLGKEEYLSTLAETDPEFAETLRTPAIVV